jgi:predicted SAM-dependent methyltransferase
MNPLAVLKGLYEGLFLKVNLGPGPYPLPGYVNIDADPSVNPDIVRDITRGLPFADDSVDEVRAWHVLEHLAPDDLLFVVSESYRILKPGRMFDVQVPLGVTDDPTHRTFYHENSFDVFTRADATQYYLRGCRWEIVSKEVLAQRFPCLHVALRACKG